jgi:hypothetical protein
LPADVAATLCSAERPPWSTALRNRDDGDIRAPKLARARQEAAARFGWP